MSNGSGNFEQLVDRVSSHRGRDVVSIILVGGGHLGRASGSEIEHLVWGVKQCKPASGSGDMLPLEVFEN